MGRTARKEIVINVYNRVCEGGRGVVFAEEEIPLYVGRSNLGEEASSRRIAGSSLSEGDEVF